MVGSSNQMVKNEEEDSRLADEDANLMVKMKFLPYKVMQLPDKLSLTETSCDLPVFELNLVVLLLLGAHFFKFSLFF